MGSDSQTDSCVVNLRHLPSVLDFPVVDFYNIIFNWDVCTRSLAPGFNAE